MAETDENREWRSHTEAQGVMADSGLEWIVLGLDMGWRCGYVRVPEDHPWFGLRYFDATDGRKMPRDSRGRPDFFADSDIDWDDRIESAIEVHGGLTYAGERPGEDCKEGWWFGFDCAHLGDGKDPSLMSDSVKRLNAEWPDFESGPICSADYVQGQCERLARQLAEAATRQTQEADASPQNEVGK